MSLLSRGTDIDRIGLPENQRMFAITLADIALDAAIACEIPTLT